MDNISENFERYGNKEFRQFLNISKAAATELESQLDRALDRNHIDQSTFDKLSLQLVSIQSGIGSLLGYLKNSDFKGQKKK
jgi:four helix bundle protein